MKIPNEAYRKVERMKTINHAIDSLFLFFERLELRMFKHKDKIVWFWVGFGFMGFLTLVQKAVK